MSTRQPLKDDPRMLAAKMLSDKLAESHVRMDRIKSFDNKQLAEELLEKVWAQTSVYTEQYDLLEEAIERLKVAQQSVHPTKATPRWVEVLVSKFMTLCSRLRG